MSEKPTMYLVGHDGNVFAIMGRASRLLKDAGQPEQADEMFARVTSCGSYGEALHIISEYVQTELSAPRAEVELSGKQSDTPPQTHNTKKKKEHNTHER